MVRSTIAAEALSLQEGMEDGIFLRSVITELIDPLSSVIPLQIYTDNKSVVESIHSTRMVEDKLLRLTFAALKESISSGDIIVKWCPGNLQLANCMTKKGASGVQLTSVLQSGRLDLDKMFDES